MIKHPKSQYVLNGRNNDWIKVKPEYMVSGTSGRKGGRGDMLLMVMQDNMGETVDVLVVGTCFPNSI